MDAGTAQKYAFRLGDQVRILLSGPSRTFTITGIVRFGTADNLAGATLAAFTLPTAQSVLGEVGQFDAINVVADPGANKAVVESAIARVLPAGVEVVSGQTVANEQTNDINQALSFFSTRAARIRLHLAVRRRIYDPEYLLDHRGSADPRVGVVANRRRKSPPAVPFGTGRGGDRRFVSSLIGIGLGVLAAVGLEALLRGFGIDLPSGALVFEARTVIVALVVGVGVTVVAAISPARRAVRIPPVAAITGQDMRDDVSLRRRFAGASPLRSWCRRPLRRAV